MSPPILYSPVWFSTDYQMKAVISAYQAASLITKLGGRYSVPGDAAFLRGILMPWMRMPLVFTTQGELNITGSEISFRPIPYRTFGWIVKSPYKKLSFILKLKDISAVALEDFKSPAMHFFDMPFTRIRTTKEPPLNNFLLCVGGRIAVPRIRARSKELRQRLLDWHGTAFESSKPDEP